MAAADPVQALEVAKRVARVYAAAELELRGKVAKRLARGIDQEGWAEKKLAELGQVRADADTVVKRLNGQAPKVVRSALEAVAGIDPTLSPKTNRRAVDVLVEQTVTKLQTTHFQLLRSTQDQFRQTVAQTVTQVATGQTTYRVAAQRVQRQLASQGLGFVDAKGRAWKLDTYARMAVRTAAAQAMVGARLNEYAEAGRTLVIVSDSPDECEKCRPWEGQVLLIDGVQATPEDRKLAAATVKEATADGLFHPNCTHDLRPYIAGLTRPFESTARDQDTEALRRERAKAEERLQQAKREDVATEPFGDSPVRDQVKAKLASAESKLDSLPTEPEAPSLPKDPTERLAKSINERSLRAEGEGSRVSRLLDVSDLDDYDRLAQAQSSLDDLADLVGEETGSVKAEKLVNLQIADDVPDGVRQEVTDAIEDWDDRVIEILNQADIDIRVENVATRGGMGKGELFGDDRSTSDELGGWFDPKDLRALGGRRPHVMLNTASTDSGRWKYVLEHETGHALDFALNQFPGRADGFIKFLGQMDGRVKKAFAEVDAATDGNGLSPYFRFNPTDGRAEFMAETFRGYIADDMEAVIQLIAPTVPPEQRPRLVRMLTELWDELLDERPVPRD